MIRLLTVLIFPFVLHAQNTIDVHPTRLEQQFLGGGLGFALYAAHLTDGTNSAKQEEVYQWVFEDLDIDHIRFAFDGDKIEPVNDNDDPYDFNWDGFVQSGIGKLDNPAQIILAGKARKASLRIMPYTPNVPDWLQTFDGEGDITGYINDPDLYPEIAEYIFASLVYMKVNHGLTVDTIDILNEPDIKSYFGSNKNQFSRTYISNVVPALKTIIANNPQYSVIEPKVIAPSCVNLDKSADWLEDWPTRGVWQHIDYVSGHLYGGSWPEDDNARNYRRINAIKGDKLFIQNEAHPGQGLNNNSRLPAAALDDQHEGSLIFSSWFCLALNNGVDSMHYYQGNNPSENLAALIQTPWGGTPLRKKQYFAYKHFTGTAGEDPHVCQTTLTGPDSYYAASLKPQGTNTVVLNTVNIATSSRNFTFRVLDDNDLPLPILRMEEIKTGATENFETVNNTTFDPPVLSLNRWLAGEQVRSHLITYHPGTPELNVTWTDGSPSLTFDTIPGRTYQLQSSPNLISWGNDGSPIDTTAQTTIETITLPKPNNTERYYRLLMTPSSQ